MLRRRRRRRRCRCRCLRSMNDVGAVAAAAAVVAARSYLRCAHRETHAHTHMPHVCVHWRRRRRRRLLWLTNKMGRGLNRIYISSSFFCVFYCFFFLMLPLPQSASLLCDTCLRLCVSVFIMWIIENWATFASNVCARTVFFESHLPSTDWVSFFPFCLAISTISLRGAALFPDFSSTIGIFLFIYLFIFIFICHLFVIKKKVLNLFKLDLD